MKGVVHEKSNHFQHCYCFLLYLVLNLNSYNLYLTISSYQNPNILARGFDNIEREYRVIQVEKDNKSELLYMSKTSLGFWKVQYKGSSIGPNNEINVLSWGKILGEKTYNNNTEFSFESHTIFAGETAIKPIEINSEQISYGVATNIMQYNNDYIIHMIYNGENKSLGDFDLYKYLLNAEMIK